MILIGLGMIGFGWWTNTSNLISNITSNTGSYAIYATGDWWFLENAILTIIPLLGFIVVMAGVWIAGRGTAKPTPDEQE